MSGCFAKYAVPVHRVRRVDAVANRDGREICSVALEPGRRCCGALDVAGIEFFGVFQVTGRHLKFPCGGRPKPHTTRHRVEAPEIEVPAIVVRFTSVEHRPFDDPGTVVDGGRDEAERDVRRIKRVVRQRSYRVVRGRGSMHERDRSERGLPDRASGQRQPARAADRHAPNGRELHEEIVRVLPIDQRSAVDRFADLKDLAITSFPHRRGVEAEHRVERELRRPNLPRQHAHPPVRHREAVATARASLAIEHRGHDPFLHELPPGTHVHLHVLMIRLLLLCPRIGDRRDLAISGLGDSGRRQAHGQRGAADHCASDHRARELLVHGSPIPFVTRRHKLQNQPTAGPAAGQSRPALPACANCVACF